MATVGEAGRARFVLASSLGLALAACALLATGCGNDSPSSQGTPGGQAGSAATGGAASSGTGGVVGLDAGFRAEPSACPELPAVAQAQTARLALQLALEVDGAPFALGETTSDGLGGTYKLSFLAYYLTNFWLIDANGLAHSTTLLGADDVPLGYGLRLVNVDDPSTQQLKLAVAPGQYRALVFSVGVPGVCNAHDLTTRGYPLTLETEMNWGWTMLNVRLEGSHVSVEGNYPLEYHVGFPTDFRTVEVAAALDLEQGPLQRTLAFEIDKLLGIGLTTSVRPYPEMVDSLSSTGTFLLR